MKCGLWVLGVVIWGVLALVGLAALGMVAEDMRGYR